MVFLSQCQYLTQMAAALKQAEASPEADVPWEVGINKHTLSTWKAKYGGME
jgi:hypothetical protein